MKIFKKMIIALGVAGSFFMFNEQSFAEVRIGLVDMPRIIQNYDKANEAQAKLMSNQDEIKMMINKARENVQKIEEENKRKELEQKLADEIVEKNNKYRQNFSKQWEQVQDNILSTINKVAERENFDIVMDSQHVISGGEDITDKVLKELTR